MVLSPTMDHDHKGPSKASSPRALGRRGLVALILGLGCLWATSALAEGPTHHVVQPGESLRTVADAYGCSLKDLFLANKDTVEHHHMLGVGTKLIIPACAGADKAVDPEEIAVPAAEETPGPQHCGWGVDAIDRKALRTRLTAEGFTLPDYLQLVVVETTPTEDRAHVASQRVLALGPVTESAGWHPGLSVGLFSAIGALDHLTHLGFDGEDRITFSDAGGSGSITVEELLTDALRQGKPLAHNRLVQLAGSDRLHGPSGVLQRRGLDATVLRGAFDAAAWADRGQGRALRRSPAITLGKGRRAVQLPPTEGARLSGCDQEACTSLVDLARAMCLVTQNERLPASRRLALGQGETPKNLALLRSALQRTKRQRPSPLEFPFMHKLSSRRGYDIYRRAGQQDGWTTIVVGITSSTGRPDYVVAMTAAGKTKPMVKVAKTLAEWFKKGAL